MKKRMRTHNPDHHHHTSLKPQIQKMENLTLMLKTKKSQTSVMVPKCAWMTQRITILRQKVKIAEMKTEIIKFEINNSKDLRQLQKKHKISL